MNIAQVLYAGSWGEVTPETINKGLGGRETAMIKLAEAWAREGHHVTNFVNVEKGRRFEQEDEFKDPEYFDGYHEYVPISMTKAMLGNMPWDAVVAWEMPSVFSDPDIRENVRVKICEMQVAHFAGNELEAANEYCDYVAGLSKWHSEFLIHSGLEMKNGKVIALPNGVDLDRYPEDIVLEKIRMYKPKPDPSFVYSSSPDRGLWHLLKAWPLIRKNFPQATLQVCYGLDKYLEQMRWAHTRHAQMCVEIEELINQPGVQNLGKIGQDALALLQMSADAWLYPLDALWPTETGCITAVENAAAGNPLVFTNGDCLESEFGNIGISMDLPFDAEEFTSMVTKVLNNEELYRSLATNGRLFAEKRSWKEIGSKWLSLFETDLS